MRRLILISSLLMAACSTDSAVTYLNKDTSVKPLYDIRANLAFTCAHETIPESSAEADVLFQYARWLQKNNQLKQDKTVDAEIERLYRIAAENGHYKANINLQNGTMRGEFNLLPKEHLRLSENLMKANVATGYYFIGIFLKNGSAGLKQDEAMALRYFRKAADLGSAQAQAYVADKLAPSDIAPDIARQMRRCAAEQGHGDAAVSLAINLKNHEQYRNALEVFQLGVAGGNSTSASFLEHGFRGPKPDDELNYLAQEEDIERADRYEKIWNILADYYYANPKVPEINDILPLPPAPLPAWDGKLQWLEARLANVPPEKPSEELINELAKAMVLEPHTGKPMPGSPSFLVIFPEAIFYSGNACPTTGYWKVIWPSGHKVRKHEVIRHFEQGDILPMQVVTRYYPRFWPLSPKTTYREEWVEWGLFG